jgi:hypothetical protein
MATKEMREGVAYHDGQVHILYDPSDRASVEAVLLQQRGQVCYGPLCIAWTYQQPATLMITVTLVGVEIASCDLNLSTPGCTVGGSIDGFSAQVTLTLEENPLQLAIDAKVCAPWVGCKSWNVTIPLHMPEDATSLDGHRTPVAARA